MRPECQQDRLVALPAGMFSRYPERVRGRTYIVPVEVEVASEVVVNKIVGHGDKECFCRVNKYKS